MTQARLQAQSVLYKTDKAALRRVLEALVNALRVERETEGLIGPAALVWGDASPEPSFTEAELAGLRAGCGELLTLDYRFFGRNTGSALGHDLLAQDTKAELLLILNPDVLLAPRSLMLLHRALREPGTALAEARQTPLEHPKHYDETSLETPWASTACALLRTEAFRAVGGFDSESFFLYGDDVDLSWRLRLAGWRLRYCPEAPVCHPKRLTAEGRWDATEAERRYAAECALLLSWKYSRPKRLHALLRRYAAGDENERLALRSFLRRRAEGRLPQPLDRDNRVASFKGWAYSAMRYGY